MGGIFILLRKGNILSEVAKTSRKYGGREGLGNWQQNIFLLLHFLFSVFLGDWAW